MGVKHAKELPRRGSSEIYDEEIDMLLKHTHFTREEIIEQHKKYMVGYNFFFFSHFTLIFHLSF